MALRNGSRFAVSMTEVFPHGCCLVPDSISEGQDYDEKTKTRRPAIDKLTGQRVFQCRVVDLDPELEGGPGRRWSRSWPTGCRPRRPGCRSRRWTSTAW